MLVQVFLIPFVHSVDLVSVSVVDSELGAQSRQYVGDDIVFAGYMFDIKVEGLDC